MSPPLPADAAAGAAGRELEPRGGNERKWRKKKGRKHAAEDYEESPTTSLSWEDDEGADDEQYDDEPYDDFKLDDQLTSVRFGGEWQDSDAGAGEAKRPESGLKRGRNNRKPPRRSAGS